MKGAYTPKAVEHFLIVEWINHASPYIPLFLAGIGLTSLRVEMTTESRYLYDQLDIWAKSSPESVRVSLLGVKIAVFVEFPNSTFDHKGRLDVIPGPTDAGTYTSRL